MPALSLSAAVEPQRLKAPFRISGYEFLDVDVVVVTLDDGERQGRGEAAGVYYLGDDAAHIMAEIDKHRPLVEAGIGRDRLREAMPAGGARNAIDCALWDLEARRTRIPVWKLADVAAPHRLVTTFTLGADTPEAMAEGARAYASARSIKLKLTGELQLDITRVAAVRAARPTVWIGVDANQGYTAESLPPLIKAMAALDVALIEQPLARGAEAGLDGVRSPIPIAADESALTLADLKGLLGRFDVVNIKLDKCGGLTEGLAMARKARQLGFQVMVGNMVGTSLAMAPAFVLGQLCDVVDLDGPTFLSQDRAPSLVYEDGLVWAGEEVWGGAGEQVAA